MKITSGKIESALKVCVYGPEGIGKSTFASQFPDPLFIDTEGSTKFLDVSRLDAPSSWQMLIKQIEWVRDNRPCKTLVIDTLDWAEKLAKDDVIASGGEKIKSIEDFGYGKGYTFLQERWGVLLNKLTDVVEAGVHVCVTAHAMMRKFEQPNELSAYDRWELKLEKKTAPITKEWADIILFANYETYTVKDQKTGSTMASGGNRVMYTTHHPAWDAKNRHGLDEKLDFKFSEIAHLFANGQQDKPAPKPQPTTPPEVVPIPVATTKDPLPKALRDLMDAGRFTDKDLLQACGPMANGGLGIFPADMKLENYPPDFLDHVIANWQEFEERMLNNNVPFDF